MAQLGLAGYASSESEAEEAINDARVHVPTVEPARAVSPPQTTANDVVPAAGYDVFTPARKRQRYRKGGLPLFSRPIEADGASDSDSDGQVRVSAL
jgi:hypothetical protein